MADELVTIAEYTDSMQAEMAVQALADFGIKAVLLGQHAADVFGGVTAYFTMIKLQVKQSDADEAKQILEEQQQGHEPEDYEVMDETDDDEPYEPDEEKK
jgi:3-isopropylmalate dehydratase small subunit